MADILDANPFIPDTPSGGGPMEAASDPVGALQAMSGTRPPTSAAPVPAQGGLSTASKPFGTDAQRGFQEALMARLRTPEQLQAARDERRGALETFQKANSAPMNDMSPAQRIMQGFMNDPNRSDAGVGFKAGVANAMNMAQKEQELARSANIENAQAGQKFLTGEEGIADKAEQTSLNNTSKILAQRMKNGGFLNTARGVINTNNIDENGQPQLVLPSAVGAKLTQAAIEQARKMADSKALELNFQQYPDPAKARTDYIMQQADVLLKPAMAQMGLHPGVSQDLLRDYMQPSSGSDSGDQSSQKKPAPGFLTNGFDESKLTPEQQAYLKKTQPEAYANGLSAFSAAGRIPGGTPAPIANVGPVAGQPAPAGTPVANVGPFPTNRIVPAALPPGTTAAGTSAMQSLQKTGAEEYDNIQKLAKDAQLVNQTTQDLDNAPPTETGVLARLKMRTGNALEAVGLAPDMVKNATNLNIINTQLEQHIAQQLHNMKGAASSEDVDRYRKMMPSISDPVAVFKYNLQHSRELALRQQEQADFYDQYGNQRMQDPLSKAAPYQGARTAWSKQLEQMGPSFRTVVDKQGKETQYFRSQAERDALARYPDADPVKVKEAFEKAWRENPAQFGERSK